MAVIPLQHFALSLFVLSLTICSTLFLMNQARSLSGVSSISKVNCDCSSKNGSNSNAATMHDIIDTMRSFSEAPEVYKPPLRNNNAIQHQERPRNINIVMIGDSLTRYQYLSLVYFLRWGQWFDPNVTQVGNLVDERSWRGLMEETVGIRGRWNNFLYHSNRLLQPYEVCDCFRPSSALDAETLGYFVENRYFYEPTYNNTVIFLQAFGHKTTLHGRIRDPTQIWNGDAAAAATWKRYNKLLGIWTPYEWEYAEWHDAIREHVAPLQPDHVVMNAAFWENKFGIEDTGNLDENDPNLNNTDLLLKQVMTSIESSAGNNATTRCGIWRTITFLQYKRFNRKMRHPHLDGRMCQHFLCLDVSWTRQVPQSYYWDTFHFLEPVYRVMNEAMLEQMGYITPAGKATAGAELQRLEELHSQP